MVVKRNLTIQLDEEVIQDAKVLAARRGTSVSGLIAQNLRDLTTAAARYEQAKRHALAALPDHWPETFSSETTGRSWAREDI